MVQIVTQHNNVSRTGANLHETRLTTRNVRAGTFGKLFHRRVDGHIYAQPLYMPGLAMPGHSTRNVVFVATMHNSVYAFDADQPSAAAPLWHRSLEPSSSLPDTNIGFNCGRYADIAVEIGILSTPVIDPTAGTIYLVTFTRVGAPGSLSAHYQHWLHGLNITTGAERPGSPRQISATINTNRGTLRFDSKCQNQRPGLLLTGGRLYVAFASYCDSGPYHGWVLGYDPSNLQPAGAFSVSPNGDRGGVWQAGTGLTADSSHNIYFVTGNGAFDANLRSFGDCLVKLDANLILADWFSPFNNQALSGADNDLGSSGVLLLPGTNLLVTGGKEGRLYLINRSSLGHSNPAGDTQIVQSFQATGVPNAAGVPAPPNTTHHIHGSPVHWHGPGGDHVYVWGENDWLRAYHFDGQRFSTIPGASEIDFKTILSETAIGAPALGADGGRLGIAWTGTDPDNHLNFETSLDGHTFGGKVTLIETSIDGPGLAFGSGEWFMAWTGTDPDHHVNVIASADGVNFSKKVTLNETSPFGPALAFGNGRLFLAWVGTDANHSLNLLSSVDGSNFFNKVTLVDNSASAPGLSFIDGRLYLLWRGTDPNHSLNIMESPDGVTFGNKVVLADSSDFHPTLIKFGQLCLAWTGRDAARSLNTLTGATTNSLANKRTFGDQGAAAPALVNIGASAYLGWSGTDTPSHLNLSHVLGEPLPATSTMLAPDGMPGGMLSVSANGSTAGTGILWASLPFHGDANHNVVPGILRAFDAADVRTELWNSKQNAARDDVGNFAKFCCPTVADGKVFLGTFSGYLAVYGLL